MASDFSKKHWEAGGASMHLTLMFQLSIAQSQNQTGHDSEVREKVISQQREESSEHDTVTG